MRANEIRTEQQVHKIESTTDENTNEKRFHNLSEAISSLVTIRRDPLAGRFAQVIPECKNAENKGKTNH